MTEPLNANELNWLLGLAGNKRRRREKDLQKLEAAARNAGTYSTLQREEHHRARQTTLSALTWTRSVEDHLILLIAELDIESLRPYHRDRLEQLRLPPREYAVGDPYP